MTACPAPAATLHQRIRAEVEANILSGAWPPGHRIPYEHELMEQFGCARATVSHVLTALADAGLIERRRRAGSFVAQPRLQSAVLEIPDLPAEVAARGKEYGYELLSRRRRVAGAKDAAFSMPAGTPLLDLRCRHLANGRPFALEQRLINLDTVPEAEGAAFHHVPPGSWLLQHVPWTQAEHRLTAVNATAHQAELLHRPPGAACLAMDRRTWRGGSTVTFARQVFPGDAYDLVARFGPAGSPPVPITPPAADRPDAP